MPTCSPRRPAGSTFPTLSAAEICTDFVESALMGNQQAASTVFWVQIFHLIIYIIFNIKARKCQKILKLSTNESLIFFRMAH